LQFMVKTAWLKSKLIFFIDGVEMNFYKVRNMLTECALCEHRCQLKPGQSGLCGVNRNEQGELVNLVYGYPVALQIDPVEKKPLRHFLSGTETFSLGTFGCNLHCRWCQNYQLSQTHLATPLTTNYYAPAEIVNAALSNNCASISYTYNEPTVFYRYAHDIGMLAKSLDLKNIMVTNGYQTSEVIADMNDWVDACNVDLKSFSAETYQKLCGCRLDIVLRNLKLIANSRIHLEISSLIIPGINDSEAELKAMAEFITNELGSSTVWHVSAFHPDFQLTDRGPTPPETIWRAVETGRKAGLKFVFPGNI